MKSRKISQIYDRIHTDLRHFYQRAITNVEKIAVEKLAYLSNEATDFIGITCDVIDRSITSLFHSCFGTYSLQCFLNEQNASWAGD